MLDNNISPVCIALGYFDGVHLGHQKVIERAVQLSKKLECNCVVFSFDGNLKRLLGNNEGRFLYSTAERESLIESVGASSLFEKANKTFLSKGKRAFLNYLNKKFLVKGYVCGYDYRFGKGGKGDTNYLTEYARAHGQECIIVPPVSLDGETVSTTEIKNLLSTGNVEKAKLFLGKPYSITGMVKSGRKVGRDLGFPTVNIKPEKDRAQLKFGVYSGFARFGEKKYSAIINYGTRPTFCKGEAVVEAHLVDFSSNIYGEKITVFFEKFVREEKKFLNRAELIKQIKKDLETLKEI